MKKLILPLSLLLLSAACKKNADSDLDTSAQNTPAEQSSAAPPTDAPALEGEDPSAVENALGEFGLQSSLNVISEGSAPRHEIRFDLANMELGEFFVETLTETSIGGQTMKTPKMTIPMNFALVERKSDSLRVRMTTGKMRVDANPANAEEAAMAQMLQQSMDLQTSPDISFDIDGYGRTSNYEIHNESQNPLDEMVRQALDSSIAQVTAQLPSQAVGVGAEWTLSQTMNLGLPAPFTIVAKYKVREISADRVVADVTIERSQVTVPVDEANVMDMHLSAEGEVTFTATSPTPESEMRMLIEMNTNDPSMGVATTRVQTTIHRN